jgi:hypothetical protein
MSKISDDRSLLFAARKALDNQAPLSDETALVLIELIIRHDPTVQQKLHEHAYCLRNPDYVVRAERNGADLVNVKTGGLVEHKAVTLLNSDLGMRGTVNFPLPVRGKSDSLETFKRAVYQTQMQHGDLHMTCRNGKGIILFGGDIVIPAAFISGFLANHKSIAKPSSKKIAISVTCCPTCKRSHKLDFLKKKSAEYSPSKREDADFWKSCYVNIPTKCKQ